MHKYEAHKAYSKALETLETWKRDYSDAVDEKYNDMYGKCQAAVKELQMKNDELQRMIADAKGLLSADNTVFMKNVKKISFGIDDLLPIGKQTVQTQEELCNNLRLSLDRDNVTSKRITVKEDAGRSQDGLFQDVPTPSVEVYNQAEQTSSCEKRISTPQLRFTGTNNNGLKIFEGGMIVVNTSRSGESGNAWTGERFQQGRMYWEFAILPNPAYTENVSFDCRLNVKQEGESRWIFGKTYWGVRLKYRDNDEFKCITNSSRQEIIPAYSKWKKHEWTHRVGCFLDCENRSFQVIDLSDNQVIFIFRDISLAKALIPDVWLSSNGNDPYIRVIPPNHSMLSPAICEILGIE